MYRREINKYIEKSASIWLLTGMINFIGAWGGVVVKALSY
jgi:hypothetical protein